MIYYIIIKTVDENLQKNLKNFSKYFVLEILRLKFTDNYIGK